MAIDITIKDPSGTTTYYPKTVSDLVYDNDNGKTVKTELDELKYDSIDITDQINVVGWISNDNTNHPQYTDFSHCTFTEVSEGDVISVYGYCGTSNVAVIFGYDDDKQPIGALLNGNSGIIDTSTTIGSGVSFVRVSMSNSTHASYVDGSYCIIKHNIINGVKEKIEYIETKYNDDINDIYTNRTFKIIFPSNHYAIKADCSYYAISTFDITTYIPVTKGTKIIVNGYSGPSSAYATAVGYDSLKANPVVIMEGFGGNKTNQQVTIDSDTIKYVRISVANSTHSSYVRNDCYIIATSDFVKDLYNTVEVVNFNVNETENPNLIPTDSRLDGNTVIAESAANGWALFLNDSGSVTVREDCVEVYCPNQQQYEGIRNNVIPVWSSYDSIEITAEVKWVSNNSPQNIYFYWAGNPNFITVKPTTDGWTKVRKVLVRGVDSFSRMQFCLNNKQGTFQVRNYKVANAKKPLYGQIEDVENTCTELDERITALENIGMESPLKGKKIAVIGDSISTIYGGNTPSWKIKSSDVGQTIEAWVTYYDIGKTIGGVTIDDTMYGYKQSFVPTIDDVGKEIGTANNYNVTGTTVWSQQLCNLAGCTLVCNASWSGAQLVKGQGEYEDNSPKNSAALSYSWSDYTMSRFINNVDENGQTIIPDVIFIYRGTNDATHAPHGYCTKLDMKDGTPTTDLGEDDKRYYQLAANILVGRLRTLFPKVTIYFCTMNYFRRGTDLGWTRKFSGNETLAEYNDCIRDIANKLGCGVVEFDKDGISPYVDPTVYYRDGDGNTPTHPNTKGHLIMAKRALADVRYVFEG